MGPCPLRSVPDVAPTSICPLTVIADPRNKHESMRAAVTKGVFFEGQQITELAPGV